MDDAGKPLFFEDEPKEGVGCGVGRVLLMSPGMTILPLGSCDGPTVLPRGPSRAG